MNHVFASDLESNLADVGESSTLVFVDDADYEFVGGGAAAVNNL